MYSTNQCAVSIVLDKFEIAGTISEAERTAISTRTLFSIGLGKGIQSVLFMHRTNSCCAIRIGVCSEAYEEPVIYDRLDCIFGAAKESASEFTMKIPKDLQLPLSDIRRR